MTSIMETAAQRVAGLPHAMRDRSARAAAAAKARLSAAYERASDAYDHVCDTCFGDLTDPLQAALFAVAVGMSGAIVALGLMAWTSTGIFA